MSTKATIKPNIPILTYNELRPLMNLGHDHHSNGIVVDEASLEIMLRIEKIMQRLQVMGDDDRRYLWIHMKAPQKRNREDDADKDGFYWYMTKKSAMKSHSLTYAKR